MVWTLRAFDTLSGDPLLEMPTTGGSWTTSLAAPETGSHALPVRAPVGLSREDWRYLTRPWAVTFAQCWNGIPKYAGPLLRRTWDDDTGILSVNHAEIRSIFARRYTWGVDGYSIGRPLSVVDRGLSGTVRAIVNRGAIEGAAVGHPWRLPIVLPPDSSGDIDFTWENWSFQTIEDALAGVEGRHDAPHIHFDPRLSASGRLEWVCRVGSPLLPGVTRDVLATADRDAMTGLSIIEDGSGQLTGVFALGRGTGEDTPVGFAGTFANFTTPILDRKSPQTNAPEGANLTSLAQGELAENRNAKKQLSFAVMAQDIDFNDFTLGARVRVGFFGHWWQPDGWINAYVIGMSGDFTNRIELTVQEA